MEKNKTDFYENATRQLLKRLDSMGGGLSPYDKMRAKNFILLFRDGFKSETVKYNTFYPILGDKYKLFTYDSDGFCRASSSAFVSLMNADWQLMYIDEIWTYGPHFYVQHIPTRHVLDITFDQYKFYDFEIPYYLGRPTEMNSDNRDIAKKFLNSLGIGKLVNNNGKD